MSTESNADLKGTPEASEDRDRFLIAFAKFLGENPTQKHPLAGVQICEEWFLSELLLPVLPGGGSVRLSFEKFNQLTLASGRPIVTAHFFNYFFYKVASVADFEAAVEEFRIKAMWLFGNFKFAYKQLATSDLVKFQRLIQRTTPKSDEEFTQREPFTDIEPIPEVDLGFLGYISGQRLDDMQMALATLKLIVGQWEDRSVLLDRLGKEKQAKIASVLRGHCDVHDTGIPVGDKSEVLSVLANVDSELVGLRQRQEHAQRIGERNTQRYLVLPYLDVYVATSMRSDDDYVNQHRFVEQLFANPAVRDLKLRYFDPTASYVVDRIKKGIIECLMLRRARVTIYNAGPEDTMGKDSELAATLAQGKPVIVYVASEPRVVKVRGKDVDMENRAKLFRADHPLGLQISAKTGVAHGITVVRTEDECARMLRKILLHDLKLPIQHEGGNFRLVESETQSILRVVTDDPLLSHSFWTYFRHVEPEPDIQDAIAVEFERTCSGEITSSLKLFLSC
jgi:hypothetical protein